VIAAVGAIDQEVLPDEDQDTNLTVNAGIGAVTGPIFNNGLKLRGDARYVRRFHRTLSGAGRRHGDREIAPDCRRGHSVPGRDS